jgi:transcriptional regulator with XRE-family HTH domain
VIKRIQPDAPLKLYLAEWRDRRGMSQEMLAERMGTTKASISRWENGDRDVTGKVIAAMAAALNLEPVQLFRHPSQSSIDDMLAVVSPELRQQAYAVLGALLKSEKPSPAPFIPPGKAKH